MGLLEGLKNRVAAKLSITYAGREAAEDRIDQSRMQREKEATDKHFNERVKIAEKEKLNSISPERADKLIERNDKRYEKEKQLPGDRYGKQAAEISTKIGTKLKTELVRSGKDLLRYSQKTTGIKPKTPEREIQKEKTTTDKKGNVTVVKTYRAAPKQLQPRGRPKSYHAPRGGFTPPASSSGGGGRSGGRSVMPRMPPMNFDMGFGPAPKKKRADGRKDPMDPFNFDLKF
jgi:hypothetical protein